MVWSNDLRFFCLGNENFLAFPQALSFSHKYKIILPLLLMLFLIPHLYQIQLLLSFTKPTGEMSRSHISIFSRILITKWIATEVWFIHFPLRQLWGKLLYNLDHLKVIYDAERQFHISEPKWPPTSYFVGQKFLKRWFKRAENNILQLPFCNSLVNDFICQIFFSSHRESDVN